MAGRRRRLRARGLLDEHGLTSVGKRVHEEIEQLTDSLAYEPLTKTLSATEISDLIGRISSTETQISSSGVLPFPNPMGFPSLVA